MFVVIGLDPPRYRLAMLPAMLEKLSFAATVPILHANGRVEQHWLIYAAMDGTWFVLFAIAIWRTRAPLDSSRTA